MTTSSITNSLQVHIVSHTHWDREWYLTYEQFRLRLVGLIDRLLEMMEGQPDYRYFHLDGQTIVLEDYLEMRPEQESRLRTLISQGRILIGPWYDMPDEFLVSGESIVRNLALGYRIAARYGESMPVGYLPDLFGHIGQMPQILRLFGLDNAILWRGFGGRNAEYWWQGVDGSRVLMMHLPSEGYCNATRVHLDPALMLERTSAVIRNEAARTAVGEVLLMNGVDHVEPHPVIPELARALSARLGTPVHHSTLPAYVAAVRSGVASRGIGESLEVIEGELRGGEDYANLLPGVFSARVYLKQANARVQTLLEKRAEPLALFASMLGAPYPEGELRYAWKTLLQNHPHDSICGCSIDPVHEENMIRFARAEQVARGVVDQSAAVIAAALPAPASEAIRLVAINTTAVPFDGVVEAMVDIPYESDEPRRAIDAQALDAPVTLWPRTVRISAVTSSEGEATPYQLLVEQESRPLVMSRYETPWILRARRIQLAWRGHVPALGYAVFDVALTDAAANLPATNSAGGLVLTDTSAESTVLRLVINGDGTVDITDKRTGTLYARCGELEDVGDVGDEYNYSPPPADRTVTSSDAGDVRITATHNGPLRAAFRIDLTLQLPRAASPDRQSRAAERVATPARIDISLDADSPRVEWSIEIDNRAKDHRLRVLFPLGAAKVMHVRAETAFGVARRPAQRQRPDEVKMEVPVSYAPTCGFVEAGSETAGAVLMGEGLVEYEAMAASDGGQARLALTLLRAVGYLSRDDLSMRPSGHAGPGLETPGAQCIGTHRFRLAFEPRSTPPTNHALFTRAASFVAPPLVVLAPAGNGSLPPTDRFVQLDGEVVLSACCRSADSPAALLRVFNADAGAAEARIRLRSPIAQATRVDFREREIEAEKGAKVKVESGVAATQVAPFQIATIKMW